MFSLFGGSAPRTRLRLWFRLRWPLRRIIAFQFYDVFMLERGRGLVRSWRRLCPHVYFDHNLFVCFYLRGAIRSIFSRAARGTFSVLICVLLHTLQKCTPYRRPQQPLFLGATCLLYKNNRNTNWPRQTIVGEFFMDIPTYSFRTTITCNRHHCCHHHQSGVVTRCAWRRAKQRLDSCVSKTKYEIKEKPPGVYWLYIYVWSMRYYTEYSWTSYLIPSSRDLYLLSPTKKLRKRHRTQRGLDGSLYRFTGRRLSASDMTSVIADRRASPQDVYGDG